MDKNLSWFLGPKAENASTFEDLLHVIVNDCFHWRKNYFPDDPLLITKSDQHAFDEENDKLYQNVHEFLAALRRNFPFYNPRYIAHMLSDVTMPSLLGYIGGLLYNPNNVTTEAAPVTTEWEILACNNILEMIGFKLPPLPPKNKDEEKNYNKLIKEEFGWAHITSGGSLANIEALWVARCVKYLPLSIQDIVKNKLPNLSIELKQPSGAVKNIKDIDQYHLINIKPSESIYLLSKYIQAYADFVNEAHSSDKNWKMDIRKVSDEAMDILGKSSYSLANNMGKLLTEFPLAIFVSGTAHYSIHKAADLLGIGRNNIRFIEIGPDFRMNTDKLKEEIEKCYNTVIKIDENDKEIRVSPLAVIGIVGTTEEGAIDPIHEIYDIRRAFEKNDLSFWIHVDSAWGGYSKAILQLEAKQKCRILLNKIFKRIKKDQVFADSEDQATKPQNVEYLDISDGIDSLEGCLDIVIQNKKNSMLESILAEFSGRINDDSSFFDYYKKVTEELREYGNSEEEVESNNSQSEKSKHPKTPHSDKFRNDRVQVLKKEHEKLRPYKLISKLNTKLKKDLENIRGYDNRQQYDSAIESITYFFGDLYELWYGKLFSELKENDKRKEYLSELQLTLEDRVNELHFYTKCNLDIRYDNSTLHRNPMSYELSSDDENFVSSYLAFKYVDSVTIDPHKQGYLPYPCGVIAFKNDRIRHLIAQEAPYITSSNSSVLVHRPPLHAIANVPLGNSNDKRGNCIDAFAPFILEGSKPGAAAASLWLTNKCIPLTVNGYGTIVRDSLLSARALYTSIKNWKIVLHSVRETANYELFPVSNKQPDLNVVVFAVKPKDTELLADMNDLTNKVYSKYSLQVELGNREYSYGQPFFLSKTTFSHPYYSFGTLSNFFKRCGIKCSQDEYESQGLTVLRATLMNPYLWAYKETKNLDLVHDFMVNLHNELKTII